MVHLPGILLGSISFSASSDQIFSTTPRDRATSVSKAESLLRDVLNKGVVKKAFTVITCAWSCPLLDLKKLENNFMIGQIALFCVTLFLLMKYGPAHGLVIWRWVKTSSTTFWKE